MKSNNKTHAPLNVPRS